MLPQHPPAGFVRLRVSMDCRFLASFATQRNQRLACHPAVWDANWNVWPSMPWGRFPWSAFAAEPRIRLRTKWQGHRSRRSSKRPGVPAMSEDVVLDTSVLVAGLLSPRKSAGALVSAFFADRLRLAYTGPMLVEYAEVLECPEFGRIITPVDRIGLILKLRCSGILAEPVEVPDADWPDLDELPFVVAFNSTVLAPRTLAAAGEGNGFPCGRSRQCVFGKLDQTLPLPKWHRSGAPGGIRTHDHQLRRQVLYPTELRAQNEDQSLRTEPSASCHGRCHGWKCPSSSTAGNRRSGGTNGAPPGALVPHPRQLLAPGGAKLRGPHVPSDRP